MVNEIISFVPQHSLLSLGQLSMMLLWYFFVMVCGSIVLSTNPSERFRRYILFIVALTESLLNSIYVYFKKSDDLITVFEQSIKDLQMTTANNKKEMIQSLKDLQVTTAGDMSTFRLEIASLKQSVTSDKKEMTQTLKELQMTTANDKKEIITLGNQIVILKQFMSQMEFVTGLHDRVDFLEKVYNYQHILHNHFQSGKILSGKILAKMWKLGCYGCFESSNVFTNYLWRDEWLNWTTHATEEDLMDLLTAMSADAPNFWFPIVKVYIYFKHDDDNRYNYRNSMNEFKKNTDMWFLNWPSNMGNIPKKCKTFAEAYFTRVENVLTKLHKMNLLR